MKDALVLGIGNLLLGDDGVGVHAVRRLRREPLEGVLLVEVGTAIIRAAHLMEECRLLIVIDAMAAGGEAGSVYVTDLDGMEDRWTRDSLHELTLPQMVGTLRRRPEQVVVVGVEPGVIDWGLELSGVVEAALGRVTAVVRSAVRVWRCGGRAIDGAVAGAVVPYDGDGVGACTSLASHSL